MEEILRLISCQRYEIAEHWGLNQLSRVLVNQRLGAGQDYFEKQLQASLEIDIYHSNQYVGVYDKLDTVKPGSIGVIKMAGIMTENGGWCNKGAVDIEREFIQMYRDQNITGIMFKVSSGGGESTAGDLIYNVISDRNKPVVSYATFLGSAAVKATLQSDEIIAASTGTEIGSIGTMISINKKFIEQAKEQDLDLYSVFSPRKNEGWRELKNGNNQPLIDRASTLDAEFMKKVSKSRNLRGDKKYKDETLSGALFIANDAKRRGLIDGIGTTGYAFKRLNSHIKSFKL